jgi:ABC-type dipeptide/oligopeptide/nickel transport system permease component
LQTIPCVTFICHPFLPSIIWIIGASLPVYLVAVVPLVLYKLIKSKWFCSFGLSDYNQDAIPTFIWERR